ncbi:hypothetical protein KM1_066360 [Entamoeba histolytica HM-3:IMSS]|uniref:Uncharacterized protein n=1 Tax=Entamoeba histolytica HM-3:IMSS TaxID=885315 RepID=M7VSL0_ENTHI|nr:hypothetical protein KM1_066360 [Entamoeba histolytica HM-3:IMSS]
MSEISVYNSTISFNLWYILLIESSMFIIELNNIHVIILYFVVLFCLSLLSDCGFRA